MNVEPGRLIATGRTAHVYALDGGRVAKVLRPGFPEELGLSEARVAEFITEARIAAPRFLGTARVGGRVALLYEYCDGPSLFDAVADRPWAYRRLATLFARIQAETHRHQGSGLPSLRSRLAATIQRADVAVGIRDAALRRLDGLPEGDSLLHGDMHPGNVLLTGNGPKVIDWEAAAVGPAAAGVAHTLFLLGSSVLPPDVRPMRRRAIALLRRAFARTYLNAYRSLRPTDLDDVGVWRLPVLVARLEDGIEVEAPVLRGLIQREMRTRAGMP